MFRLHSGNIRGVKSYYAHSRIRKYAASRLRLAQYSRQISSVVSINMAV